MLLWVAAALAGSVEAGLATPDGHRYALFRPDGWTAERQWPVVVVLDPRGRAEEALQAWIPAAERLGAVVASSYDSRSDVVGDDPTVPAVRAILLALPEVAAAAPDQVVLAGMSGTARVAWGVGAAAPEVVAGVIGVAGATPDGGLPGDAPPFPWVGVAGTRDFNWQEVRRTDVALRAAGGDSAFLGFVGEHGWAPPAVLDRALAVLAGESDRLADVALPEAPTVAVDDAVQDRLARSEDAFAMRLSQLTSWLADPARAVPGLARGRSALQVRRVEKQAAAGGPEADAAARMLALARVQLGFYVPRGLPDVPRRRAALELAASLPAPDARLLYDLACARALDGDASAALDALRRAVDAGFADRAYALQDPDLASLRADPGFAAALERR
ncbi:MAG: hypothetical protein R3F59_24575 [Myxococcota bacterium]